MKFLAKIQNTGKTTCQMSSEMKLSVLIPVPQPGVA